MSEFANTSAKTDSTRRFSDRVENYVLYRPGYPEDVVRVLQREAGLTRESIIADVGSGTGISSELFLRSGNSVFAVEPNDEMRHAGERLLAAYPRFRSVPGRAEATTLPDSSVDYVTSGQAFHWFEPDRARVEFARILHAESRWVVLLWNARRVDTTPFLRAYEALLERYGTDYREVRHKNIDVARLCVLFGGELGEAFQLRRLYNEQRFDFAGLRGRLLSSSYTPTAGDPSHGPMLRDLKTIFDEHAEDETVAIEYDTEIYFGRIR